MKGSIDKDTLTIETIIHAPVAQVWKAWADPALILQWVGSNADGRGLSAELDVRPGGSFEISFANADQTEFTASGVYIEVEEPAKLVFSWSWKNEPGVESLITVQLAPENNFTLMNFKHAHFGYASAHDYLTGWQNTFQKLERLLTK